MNYEEIHCRQAGFAALLLFIKPIKFKAPKLFECK
jgi:hypothetical protein